MKYVFMVMMLMTGCYAEFDLGAKTPRRDPCTGVVENKVVYVMPTCRYVPASASQVQ